MYRTRTLTALALLALASPALADYGVLRFTGTVSEILQFDPALSLTSTFEIGDPCSGTITIQTSAPDSSGAFNTGEFDDAVVVVTLATDSYTFTQRASGGGSMDYSDNNLNGPFQGDHVRLGAAIDGPPVDGATPRGFFMQFSDADDTVFPDGPSTKSLWPFPAPVSEFEVAEMGVDFAVPDTGDEDEGEGVPAPVCAGTPMDSVGIVIFNIDSLELVTPCTGDLDGDGDTDLSDFTTLASDFGCVATNPELVTIEFGGYISELDSSGGVDFSGTLLPFLPVVGTATYDRTVLDNSTSNSGGEFFGAVQGLSIEINGCYTAEWIPGENAVTTRNDVMVGRVDTFTIDQFGLVGATIDNGQPQRALLKFVDGDGQFFANDADAQSLAVVPDFSLSDGNNTLEIDFLDFSSGQPETGVVRATLTYVRVVPTPGGCVAELDGDGDTDLGDFTMFTTGFGCSQD
ncbi:MAG: hypothetical protein AAFX05_09740 [Planctomycetota bacterium]